MDDPLCNYWHPLFTTWRQVTAAQINDHIKIAADNIGLYHYGYTEADVSSHSLRAGGAMALFLNGVSPIIIQKLGRWKSLTFLVCIHEQISAFATGVSHKMSMDIPFQNIATPTVTST